MVGAVENRYGGIDGRKGRDEWEVELEEGRGGKSVLDHKWG